MEITQQRIKEALSYDPVKGVFRWINCSKHHKSKNGHVAGCRVSSRGKTYRVIKIDGRAYKAGFLAWVYMKGEHPKGVIDHINGNSTDDRFCNLRDATYQQNSQNTKYRPLQGIRKMKSGNYQARIRVSDKHISLGSFKSREDAHAAYVKARLKYHDCPAFLGSLGERWR
jgi:hypothetical protein